MEGRIMVLKARKNLLTAMIAVIIAIIGAVTLFSYARTDVSAGAAEAAEDYKWTPSVRTRQPFE